MHVHGYDVLERRNFNTRIKLEGAPKVMTIVPSYSEVTKNLKTLEIYAIRLKNEFYIRFMKHPLVFLACHF